MTKGSAVQIPGVKDMVPHPSLTPLKAKNCFCFFKKIRKFPSGPTVLSSNVCKNVYLYSISELVTTL